MQSYKVGIFYPLESSDFFLYHLKNISTDPQASVACFQIPYPYTAAFEQQVEQAYAEYQQVIIVGCELHPVTVDFIRRFDRPRITYYLCGFLEQPLVHSTVHQYLDWFITTTDFYKRNPDLLQLDPFTPKQYVFDALLGRRKAHRQMAWDYIQQHLPKQGITTYIDNHHIDFGTEDSAKWIWERDGLELSAMPNWTVEMVTYHGQQHRLSQIVPVSIYNQTAYSLVAETNYDNDYVFFTEKTVKPILAQRLFILLGNRYSLARLRELGFKTFDHIIDESYDSIESVNERHMAALEQLRWLCTKDQTVVLQQCQSTVEHNRDHLINTNWYQQFSDIFKLQFQ